METFMRKPAKKAPAKKSNDGASQIARALIEVAAAIRSLKPETPELPAPNEQPAEQA
jgi:hypothetical protein